MHYTILSAAAARTNTGLFCMFVSKTELSLNELSYTKVVLREMAFVSAFTQDN